MRSLRRVLTASGAAAAIAATLALAPTSAGASAQGGVERLPGYQVPVLASHEGGVSVVADDAMAAKAARTAKITVTYVGFSAPAKAAFQRAVNAWAAKLSSPVPITVKANWAPLGSGVLGSAGPSHIWKVNNVWYADALANKKAGRQLDSAPDVVANFSSSFTNWHFGTGPAPAGMYDFQSVVTHELGHGVGFLGLGNVSGGLGTVKHSGSPSAYDLFTELGTGAALKGMPDKSAKLAAALTSDNVFFDSAAVRTANGGKPAKLYAPSTWRQGSSYSHLNESTYPKGNQNSLMTYAISGGETIRTPGPVALAILKTTGW